MDPPPITLIMVKGPRKGETIGFQPGSTIRIGRVVRGNNVPIKDAGISSKNLTIESGSRKWILRDLGSSNGTTLNSDLLPPDTPFDLNDGDTLKLGESASILIKFEGRNGARDEEAEVAKSRRSNPPRRGKTLKKELENLELGKKENVRVRVTRSRKNEDSVDCCSVSNPIVVENHKTEVKRTKGGRPRGRKKNQPEEKLEENETNLRDEVVAEAKAKPNPPRNKEIHVRKDEEKANDWKTEVKENCDERGEVNLENHETESKRWKVTRPRGRKKNQPEEKLEKNETNLRDEVVAEAKAKLNPSGNKEIDVRKDEEKANDWKTEVKENCDERGEVNLENHETESKRWKVTRPRGKKKNQPAEKLQENETNLRDEVGAEAKAKLNPSRNKEIDERKDEEKANDWKTEVKENCDGRGEVNMENHETELKRWKVTRPRGREKNRPEEKLEEIETNLSDEVVLEVEAEAELNPSRNEEINVRKDEEKAEESISKVKESCDQKVEVDLETMTLKGWFDYLEVQLPRTIIESTEEMIEGMRKKADRVKEYMMEQKLKQGKAAEGYACRGSCHTNLLSDC